MLDHALAYLERGWSVIPAHEITDGTCSCGRSKCPGPGKHPRIAWTVYQSRRPSPEEARRWWQRWPNANIAIVTGAVSGLVALDIDPRHGGDESVHDLGELPSGPVALTGGGGQHLFFAHPGRPIANGANLLPGIDLRGDGGYVIAPPSSHHSGRQYEWETETEGLPLPDLPEAVTRLLNGYKPELAAGVEGRFSIETILAHGVAEGQRNTTMAQLAGHYIGEGNPPWETLMFCAGINAAYFRPPLPEEEVRQTVDSIWRRQQRKAEVAQAATATVAGDIDTGQLPAEERLAIAARIWQELGVEGVTSWRLFLSDPPVYLLQTGEGEARLGDDLLAQPVVRKRLLTWLGVLVKPRKQADWEAQAYALHKLALVEEVEGRSDETIDDWIDAYLTEFPAQEWDIDRRRAAFSSGPITADGDIWLRPAHLRNYVEAVFGEKVTMPQIRRALKQAGWAQGHLRAGAGTQRGWRKAQR